MPECSVDLAELTDDESVVPVAAYKDIHYDYNVINVVSNGAVTLGNDFWE